LPKGSLEKATLDLFDAADLAVRRGSDRDYHASIDHPGIDRVRFLRPQEIPEYVEEGLFDLGITGRDWIAETDSDVVSLGELQYSKTTSSPVRVVLAIPRDAPWQSAADLTEGIRISTEFPDLTETGSSLRKNGLRMLDTLLSSYTELVANRAPSDEPAKRAAMDDIALLLSGAIRARGQVLVKLN